MKKIIAIGLLAFTTAAQAECPLIDLFGCKAKAEEQERKIAKSQEDAYQKRLDLALAYITNHFATTSQFACSATMAFHEEDLGRCAEDLEKKYKAYKNELISSGSLPKNCHEWAITKGEIWEKADVNMRVNPLGIQTSPVGFIGSIEDGSDGKLLIYSSSSKANALVRVTPTTFVIDASNFKIGGDARGYGNQVDKAEITLVSGQGTTIPIIDAACIE